jgi:hypothetical protein
MRLKGIKHFAMPMEVMMNGISGANGFLGFNDFMTQFGGLNDSPSPLQAGGGPGPRSDGAAKKMGPEFDMMSEMMQQMMMPMMTMMNMMSNQMMHQMMMDIDRQTNNMLLDSL